jgi:glucosamine--fructose-6-phosphate aminotransferase (isomerizing)
MLAGATARARRRETIAFDGLVDAVGEAVHRDRDAARLARGIGSARALVVLGRGYAYTAALEAALKIKELARVWAEPYSSADFAHGPRTLLERGTPVLLLSSTGVLERESRALVNTVRRRGAKVFAITNDERLAERADDAIVLETQVAEPLAPIALVVAAQLLAAHVARRHGRDPERPAGISKVTRTL